LRVALTERTAERIFTIRRAQPNAYVKQYSKRYPLRKAVSTTSLAKSDVPIAPPNTFVPSVETCAPHRMWPLSKLSKVSLTPKGEYKQFFADDYREADASIRLPHCVVNSHEKRRGSQEVTIVRIAANNGFVRGNRSQLFLYL
jgi:hypothetical protein